jgi:hypothetical protein
MIRAPSLSAQIAQLVEQRTENPRVTGSIPVLGILICVIRECNFSIVEKLHFCICRMRRKKI